MPDLDLDYHLVDGKLPDLHRHVPDPDGDGDGVDPRFIERLTPYLQDRGALLPIIDYLTRRVPSSWAILVVTFRDDPIPSQDLTRYQQVFTSAGAGTMNMVDYFADMSHGRLDLSGSRVFGPFVLDYDRADYLGNVRTAPAGKLNREGVRDAAKAAAISARVPLSSYDGVVVCGTPQLDLCGWVGGRAALCDDLSLEPSLLGQEMGHGYGSDHSWIDGSNEDYEDPWDTMSTARAYEAPHPTYGHVGPGLNAINMRLRGWLDTSRVLTIDAHTASDQTYDLRPLHARRLSGNLAIAVGEYLVELRLPTRWDAGIPRACVLVHRAEGNRSVLMRGTSGRADLSDGDEFTIGREDGLFGTYVKVHVDAIDESGQRARVRITHVPAYRPHLPQLGGTVIGGVPYDGPGFIIIGGKPHPVPPRGPEVSLVNALGDYLEARSPAEQLETLTRLAAGVGQAFREVEVIGHAAPRSDGTVVVGTSDGPVDPTGDTEMPVTGTGGTVMAPGSDSAGGPAEIPGPPGVPTGIDGGESMPPGGTLGEAAATAGVVLGLAAAAGAAAVGAPVVAGAAAAAAAAAFVAKSITQDEEMLASESGESEATKEPPRG
jgi:hypothetical protein